MRVLAFRHVPFEGVGLIGPALEARGISLEYVDLYRPDAEAPEIADAAGLIFLGGPMSVNDPLRYLDIESDLIVQAVERTMPVLGICLGSQLIARALGSRVYRNPVKEIGWFETFLTEAAASDPLFSGMNHSETLFHWHGETWDLPRGATRLAWSEACPNQAFLFGSNIYGLQFHLEVTPAMIADWCFQDENCGDLREISDPIDPMHNCDRLAELSEVVFGRWCDLL